MSDVILRGPIGKMALRLSLTAGLSSEAIYAALLSLWSTAIAPTVKISSWGDYRPTLIWVALISNSAERSPSLLDIARQGMGDEIPFDCIHVHENVTTARQLHNKIKKDLKKSSEAREAASSLLAGSPFSGAAIGRYRFQKDLEFPLRLAWDGGNFRRWEDERRDNINAHPTLGVLWEISKLEWMSGTRSIEASTYTRFLPIKADANHLYAITSMSNSESKEKELSAAYEWGVGEQRVLELDDGGRQKWIAVRKGERILADRLMGERRNHFVRMAEHTLRVAATLAASERSTTIDESFVEAAWSLVRRSIRDTFELTHAIDGPLGQALAEIDAEMCEVIDRSEESTASTISTASEIPAVDSLAEPVRRRTVIIESLARDNRVVRQVKQWYRNCCQMCGITLRLPAPASAYSEGAHIQALGGVHAGPDRVENLLCLCPNCHVLFDNGARYLTDDFCIMDALTGKKLGMLTVHPQHHIGIAYVRQHRQRWESQ